MSGSRAGEGRSLILIRLYQQGNQDAGNELFSRYYPKVQRIVRIRARSRGLDLDAAEDVVQETFLAAARSFSDFEVREEGALVNWLATIAEHEILDELRKRHSSKRDPEKEIPLTSGEPSDSDPVGAVHASAIAHDTTQVPDKAARRELSSLIDECLLALEQSHREVILLRRFAECTWELVAKEVGCASADSARKLYGRACKSLDVEMRRRTKS